MKKILYEHNCECEKIKEKSDSGRLNKDSENKNLFEGMEEKNQVERNLTGIIENPSSPNGSTGSSENNKNSEINQEKIKGTYVQIKVSTTPKENKKKLNKNSIKEIKDKNKKFKIYPTPKENEKKMDEDSIEKKKETISQNNMKNDEKNMNLLGHKEPVEQPNILIDSDSGGFIDMENDNDESIIGSNKNEQEINFSIISTISTNQGIRGGVYYESIDKNIPPYIFPEKDEEIDDDDRLKLSDLNTFCQIGCNHQHLGNY
jgi:hypothetical protein